MTERMCTLSHVHQHGKTSTCYVGGRCRCDDCKQARAEYAFWRRHNPSRTSKLIDGLGTRRRLQALVAIGWTFTLLGARLGVTRQAVQDVAYAETVRDDTAAKIRGIYEALSMQVPTPEPGYLAGTILRAQRHAARMGWAPPLAWDDIDDPNEQPRGMTSTERKAAA